MLFDLLEKGLLHIGWKLKILFIKLRYGKKITVRWSDRIAFSVRFKINGNGKIVLGENIKLNPNVKLNVTDGGEIQLLGNIFINEGTAFFARDRIIVKQYTMFGPDVKVYDHDHDYRSNKMNKKFKQDQVVIGSHVWVGANSIILRGSTLEDGCVIAAGTVVKGTVPSNTLYFTKREYGQKMIIKDSDPDA